MMKLTGLGRRHAPDPRDRAYQLPDLRRESASVTSKYWLSRGVAYDQGNTSQCVAYAGVRWLTTHPIVNSPIPFGELYTQAQRVDEWPGEEPDYEGTSVRALFKVLTARGFVQEYRWASSAEMVVAWLLTRGPVVMGTDWDYGMFTPDRWGYITRGGGVAGGHAYCLIGANRNKRHPLSGHIGAVRLMNSWGPKWGDQNGRAWMSFTTLDQLIRWDGEACTAVEVRL